MHANISIAQKQLPFVEYLINLPSRELTYPTKRKGKSSSKALGSGYVAFLEGTVYYQPFHSFQNQTNIQQ